MTSGVIDPPAVSDAPSPPAGDGRARRAAPKVCHVVATTEGGTWMFEQLRELRDRHGFEVAAVVSGGSGPLVDKLDAEGIPHSASEFKLPAPGGLLRTPLAILKLALFFRRQRFDVIQTHVFVSMVFGRIAAWLADAPVRLSMIAGPFHLKAHTPRWIDRSTCWMETALIPSCEESVRLCREMGVTEDRLPLVYYSVDERRFDPRRAPAADVRKKFGWAEDAPVVGMVAYFYPRLPESRWVPAFLHGRGVKGHEDLVRAVPAILSEFPETKFLLVGAGWGEAGAAYMREVEELVNRMGLQRSVAFAGYSAEVGGILSEVDVAVQASLDENLGGTLEALLMERPLVATRVGGMVDTVRDGETGVLVNPSDPDDLARGILRLLRDPEGARSLGRAGRALILERFTLARTAEDLAGLYARLLSAAKGRREFYNPLVSLWRLAVAAPLLTWLAFRLLFVDTYLPVYLPLHAARARAVPARLYYLAVRLYWLTLSLLSRALGASYRLCARPRRRDDKTAAARLNGPSDYEVEG